MNRTTGAVHLIAGRDHPERAVEAILQRSDGKEVTILDASAGQPKAPSTLRDETAGLLGRSKKEVTWLEAQQYASAVGDASRQAYVEWLSKQADTELVGGKSIKEWFTYDGDVSLWWFTPMSRKHPVVHPYRWLFYMIFVIDHVLGEQAAGKQQEWHVWVEDRATGHALKKAVRERRSVTVHVTSRGGSSSVSRPPWWQRAWKLARRAGRLVRKGLQRLQRARRARKRSRRERERQHLARDAGEPLVLLSTLPGNWKSGAPSSQVPPGVKCADRYFGDAPWRLQARGMKVAWLPRANDYEQWDRWREGQTLPDAFPWMTVPRRKFPGLAYHFVKWMAVFVWLFSLKQAHRDWTYEGIPLGHWLREEYWSLCKHVATTQIAAGIEQYRFACRALEPDALLYINEFYSTGRQLATAAKEQATLIGVQHGMINREHTVYQFGSGDLMPVSSTISVDHIRHCPAPDGFACFGEYYAEWIGRQSGYPEERVEPVGGMRHDALAERFLFEDDTRSDGSHSEKRQAVRRELGIPLDKEIVLLCTGRAHRAGGWFAMVVQALAEAERSAFVAVKTHPSHGGASFVHEQAAKRQFTCYEVFDEGVYPLIYSADVLVTGGSTTVLEAYLLKTPVVTITANEKYEVYPFTEEGIGDAVANVRDMASAFERRLANGNAQSEDFQQERERVLRRHLHNADGAACQRLVELIRANIA